MDTQRAFANVRTTLATIEALQPEEGRASVTGTTLVWKHTDGSAWYVSYQHDGAKTLRVLQRDGGADGSLSTAYTTPLTTDAAITAHLRALLVSVLG